ncbi:ATPase inhibitor subunit zeta [Mesorhizobium japonicum]|uniref:ATPase inhibitor subunit zeta n=1 Tax=Mesorhizobium japonicum TaxID=2066070 RepID=UPI003B5B7A4E
MRADFEQPGDEDVFRKVAGDLKGSGLTVPDSEIYSKMDELASIAREQIRAGE